MKCSNLRMMLFAGAAASLVGTAAAQGEAPTYSVTVLPLPEGVTFGGPLGITDNGKIGGGFFNPSLFGFDGIVWEDSGAGGFTLLSSEYGFEQSSVLGITNDGIVFCSGVVDSLNNVQQAAMIHPTDGLMMLPSLPPNDGGVFSAASSGNCFSQPGCVFPDSDEPDPPPVPRALIVGHSAIFSGPGGLAIPRQAVYWENGQITDMGTLPGGDISMAERINVHNVIIGRSNTGSDTILRGFVWDEAGGMRELPPVDFVNPNSIANDINDFSVIVGGSNIEAVGFFATIWEGPDATPTLLPMLGDESESVAKGVNESGDAVGNVYFTEVDPITGEFIDDFTRGVLWSNGQAFDLNDLVPGLEFTIEEALDINNHGQILVYGGFDADSGTFIHAVLTPVVFSCVDLNRDTNEDMFDVLALLEMLAMNDLAADRNSDFNLNADDVTQFLDELVNGCGSLGF